MNKLIRLYKILGPGFITGAADDDPSGIGTYAQTGAQFGYSQLWTALFSFSFAVFIQEICGRIGMVSGHGLAGVMRDYYSKWVLLPCLIMLCIANTLNIGADLGAMASSAQLIWHLPFTLWLLGFMLLSLTLQIFVPHKQYVHFLKYVAFVLVAYIITAFISHQPWKHIIHATLIPHISMDREYFFNLVAILGTTISPYLFFWQATGQAEKELEEHPARLVGMGKIDVTKRDIKHMRVDTFVGMLFSQLVMYFIIVTTATTLGAHHITQVTTATEAALALKPLAGNFAFLLFAIGIIGTGLLAVPVLAGASAYAVAETLKWKVGLQHSMTQAIGFYSLITVSMLVGVAINYAGIAPFKLLYYTAVLNGLCAPPLMVVIMLISNNGRILGQHCNSVLTNIMGWSITALMSLASGFLILSALHVF